MYYQDPGKAYVLAKTEEHPPHIPREQGFLIRHSCNMNLKYTLIGALTRYQEHQKMLGTPR